MFPWKTVIKLDNSLSTPLYLQIVNAIVREITSGHLAKSTKVPGTRLMSETLSVNRKTVVQAYDELMAQGWFEAFPSRGTFVSGKLPIVEPHTLDRHKGGEDVAAILQIKSTEFTDYRSKPKHSIEINQGTPDPRLAPIDWIYKECRSLAKTTYGKNFLKYGAARGDEKLRISLSRYLSETRGMNINKENILITRGSQMGIFMILNVLLNKGDTVVVGHSSYDSADWSIKHLGGNPLRIGVDEFGLNIDELEKLLKTTKVSIVYITPHHHYPTTVTLPAERRIQLLELALKYNFAIIEDDYDYDFHYSSSPLLPLASLNHHEHVIYIGSFSKIFAPAIRIGYIVSSRRIINELSKIRGIIDRQGDPVLEHVMALAIESGELQRHLKKTLKIYLSRRDLLCKRLNEKLGGLIEYKVPEGGMALWVKFLSGLKPDADYLVSECLKRGLYLNLCHDFINHQSSMRLGFASVNEQEIETAIDILAEVIKQNAS
ncbi:PLP-dependent aminotransferase family protein [Fulvivirga sp. 29W222]|uniref:PLP-dependent aminotransferase family protein n=1 Tax=Fulvivirga marina TaxID=2494733 RepID=A0A937FT41_9BACT|nr:PLP-dependent aminotransferase family protein [Fulvivirga marina]MBL6444879.1 PLP-dependent aminotransferase family protein [Fulvivirga marina]